MRLCRTLKSREKDGDGKNDEYDIKEERKTDRSWRREAKRITQGSKKGEKM